MEKTLYDLVGEEKLKQLLDEFYERVFSNPQIGHLFKTDKDVIKEKQRLFLTQFLAVLIYIRNDTATQNYAPDTCRIRYRRRMQRPGFRACRKLW